MGTRLENYLAKTSHEKRSSAAIAYIAALDHIETVSPSVAKSIRQELIDQRSNVKLIASENFSSLAVQLAMGNLLTDKYAEGYVSHRFYAGCDNVDAVEAEGTELLKKIFGCDHAYIQPHSGSDANLVALWSILVQRIQNRELEALGKKNLYELSDDEYERIRQLMSQQKMLGMSLNSGGHLSHGYRYNVSSKIVHSISYDVDRKTGLIDYSELSKLAKKEKPAILLAGYSAYPRLINFAKMREIADSVGATLMADMAHFAGLVAGKVLTGEYDPIPYSHIVTSTTHKTMRGPRGGFILCSKEFGDVIDKGCPLVLGGPLPHVLAAKAVAFREVDSTSFHNYAHNIVDNARILAEELQKNGAKVITGGTDNHLIIIDVTPFGITGRQAEQALRSANMTANRNTIPFDTNSPWITSGIRLGTPATTTLGMGTEEMREIAAVIVATLKNTRPTTIEKTGAASRISCRTDPVILENVRHRIKQLLSAFPLYPEIEI